ncbi:MAG: FHA domain-containing protein [Deltaproteobacteria bacterium]|nr:FHA domain-containing protein [Deltaproteobacteria bacterium]
MFRLILKFQDVVVDQFEFQTTPVTIGRRDDNDIVIDNMAVSGHHAVIEEEEPNYYVVVDLESLNGTFINETKITRERIFDGDQIIIGKHKLSFIDLRPEAERPPREGAAAEKKPAIQIRDTVILDTKAQQELLAKQAAERGITPEQMAERPKKINLLGTLTILSGGTPEIIEIGKRLTTLGKSPDSDIKCSGLLVGKTAALINKRPNGYFLAYAEGLKKPEVNGELVTTQVQLHDGDEIAIGNTRMTFNLTEEIVQ